MEFIETPVFSKRSAALLPDDSLRALQGALTVRPDSGAVIPGTRALRKFRWAVGGKGKRGGLRIVYAWFPRIDLILLLLVYAKNEQEDLTPRQKKVLNDLVEAELK